MSLLTFLGLRQPKSYNRTPLTLADVLHRTLITGLVTLSFYGIYLGYSVHEHVMTKGKDGTEARIEALALKEAEAKAREATQAAEEARERSLAEAAQAALPKRS